MTRATLRAQSRLLRDRSPLPSTGPATPSPRVRSGTLRVKRPASGGRVPGRNVGVACQATTSTSRPDAGARHETTRAAPRAAQARVMHPAYDALFRGLFVLGGATRGAMRRTATQACGRRVMSVMSASVPREAVPVEQAVINSRRFRSDAAWRWRWRWAGPVLQAEAAASRGQWCCDACACATRRHECLRSTRAQCHCARGRIGHCATGGGARRTLPRSCSIRAFQHRVAGLPGEKCEGGLGASYV